jgi:hypothetical protein
MSLSRTLYNQYTALHRWWHRHGFGVQSPSDYELVRDILFEPLHYYAYKDLGLRTNAERQLYRIRLWKPDALVIHSPEEYQAAAASATDDTVMVIEDISGTNEATWQQILHDPRARVTFDMRKRGLVLFNSKRIKQNYLL